MPSALDQAAHPVIAGGQKEIMAIRQSGDAADIAHLFAREEFSAAPVPQCHAAALRTGGRDDVLVPVERKRAHIIRHAHEL